MKCQYCESEIRLHYGDKLNKELEEMQACFNCHFWLEKKREDEKLPWYGGIIANGQHWRTRNIGINQSSNYPAWMRGCGGRAYKITNTKTGESIETNDLWHQGQIPERFRHLFEENAIIEPLAKPTGFRKNAFDKAAEGNLQPDMKVYKLRKGDDQS